MEPAELKYIARLALNVTKGTEGTNNKGEREKTRYVLDST